MLAVRKELQARWGDSVGVQAFSAESKQGVEEARKVVAQGYRVLVTTLTARGGVRGGAARFPDQNR